MNMYYWRENQMIKIDNIIKNAYEKWADKDYIF